MKKQKKPRPAESRPFCPEYPPAKGDVWELSGYQCPMTMTTMTGERYTPTSWGVCDGGGLHEDYFREGGFNDSGNQARLVERTIHSKKSAEAAEDAECARYLAENDKIKTYTKLSRSDEVTIAKISYGTTLAYARVIGKSIQGWDTVGCLHEALSRSVAKVQRDLHGEPCDPELFIKDNVQGMSDGILIRVFLDTARNFVKIWEEDESTAI